MDVAERSGVMTCPNCGAPAPAKYCPECGQEKITESGSTTQFFRTVIEQWATRDGVVWRTLKRLFFAPGALTNEYLIGRRTRYVRPLQLYLTASVIVFAAVQIFGLDAGLRFYGEHGVHILRSSPPSADETASRGVRLTPAQIVIEHVDTDGIRRFKALSNAERFRFLHAKRAQTVSYFVLVLVPLFALIVSQCYRDRRRTFGTHLVFGLHTHSFLLLMLLIEGMLPAILANFVSLWVVIYFLVALQRVYGGTWVETLVKGSCVGALYFAAGFVANLVLIFALLEL